MITYEEIKIWFEDKENKQKVVYVFCSVLIFLVGFGAGKFEKQFSRNNFSVQKNYNTKQQQNQPIVKTGEGQSPAQVKGVATGTAGCLIKGNIGSKNSKIYHMPGGAFYNIVKPEQCFKTEAEAVASGFVKSSR